jgi:hypothetical protein
VQLLSLDQHLQYERESLSHYPRRSDGAIEWGSVADGLVVNSLDSDSTTLSTAIRQFSPQADSLIVFWESLAVPSVEMEFEVFISRLSDIVEFVPEFWIYSPRDGILVESSFSGVVTVAHIPVQADGRSPA